MEIKKGDNVLVIAGKDKGKKGKVLETSPKTDKLVVEGVNIVTKHKKPKSAQDKGGIVKQTSPVERSNVMVVCSVCGKATRIAHKELNGKKVRICKKCGASLDKEFVKAVKKDNKKTEQKVETKAKEVKAQEKSAVKPRVAKAESKVVTKTSTKATVAKTAKQQKIGSKGQ